MNLVLIPESTKREQLCQDDQVTHSFPAKAYTFTVNEIVGFGCCLMHALYSPMSAFQSHDSAVKTAEAFLASLMDASVESSDSIDEERMTRYLDGEDMEQIRLNEIAQENTAEETESTAISQSKLMSRRDLIRGAFLNDKVESS